MNRSHAAQRRALLALLCGSAHGAKNRKGALKTRTSALPLTSTHLGGVGAGLALPLSAREPSGDGKPSPYIAGRYRRIRMTLCRL
jgi:hypothetical protein